MPRRVVKTLIDNFEIGDDIVIRSNERLDLADWMALHRLPLPHLKDRPFVARGWWDPQRDPCVFDDMREQDFLIHHPFESFSAVELFLQQAATDPHVVGIKMTLYRVGAHSPIIDLLISAAEAGKQVAVLIELKARFDERNNIEWAGRLEDAGVHVVYGVENLKTHCKLCLVVRKEADRIHRYVHIGTGNYNRATACNLHRLRPVHGGSRRPRRSDGSIQRAHRLLPPQRLHAPAGGAGHSAARLRGLIEREIEHAGGQAGADHGQEQRDHRSGDAAG